MTTDEHGQPKHTLFSDLLMQRMIAYDPPVRQRDLAQWLGVSGAIVWNWINRGSVPRDPALLHRLAQAFGDPPEMWFRAAGRPFWPAVADPSASPHPARGGQVRTPEQDILDDIAAIRRNPWYSAETKAKLIELQEMALQGYSPRQVLIDSEHVVEGVTDTFVTVPKEFDPTEQTTRKLDALPRPSQRKSREGNGTETPPTGHPTRSGPGSGGGTQHERRGAGTGTTATARPHRAPRSSASIKDR